MLAAETTLPSGASSPAPGGLWQKRGPQLQLWLWAGLLLLALGTLADPLCNPWQGQIWSSALLSPQPC